MRKIGMYKHGMYKTKFYAVWSNMIQRCTNSKHMFYKDYGARGIKVCDHWLTFKNFMEDMYSTYKEGLCLDRIDNDKDYELSNCQWSTQSKNSKNRRNSSKVQSDVDHVYYEKRYDKWQVLRSFKTKEAAEKFAILTRDI